MRRTMLMIVLLVASSARAESVQETLAKVQDRLNDRVMESLFGGLEYEYVLAPGPAADVALLEDKIEAAAPDTAGKGVPAPVPTTVVRRDTVREADGTLRVVEHREPLAGQAVASSPGARYLSRSELPAELAAVDAEALRQTLAVDTATDPVRRYLGVRQVRPHPRYGAERVTTAELDLSPEQRRQLWWRARRLFEAWPPGSVLVLEPDAVQETGVAASALVRWRFQRPGEVLEQPQVVAAGETQLELVRDGESWRLKKVERLVDGLEAGLGG